MRGLRIIVLLAVGAGSIIYFHDRAAVQFIFIAAFVLCYVIARWVGGDDVPVDPIQPEPIKSLDLAERELDELEPDAGTPPAPR